MDHAFAPIIRILGKGPGASRDLEWDEAYSAMKMILAGEVEQLQLGAFLCLMRYKKETPTELAAFVQAVRDAIDAPAAINVDLDWPSYADKHQQLPWFILAALLLAENGTRVFMHGIKGLEGEGLMPTRTVLKHLGVSEHTSWDAVEKSLDDTNFAYMGLEHFSQPLNGLFGLRPLLGLRSPVNSLARELNPLEADTQMQGVFHPTYGDPHRLAGLLLKQPNLAVFKGGGGEIQANPYKPIKIYGIQNGESFDEEWKATLSSPVYRWRDEERDPARISALWKGELDFEPAQTAIRDTVAIALKLMGKADTQGDARAQADSLWAGRNKSRFD